MSSPLTTVQAEKIAAARRAPLWWDVLDPDAAPRAPLPGDGDVDVVVVGAGFTGLWTAYYLAVLDPSLRIMVLEKERVSFGASGRNGGWCHAEYPLGAGTLLNDHGQSLGLRHLRALGDTVDEVERVCVDEGIDCDWARGGEVALARNELHLRYALEWVEEHRAMGLGAEEMRLLGADEARELVGASDLLGATFAPHAAAVHPTKLVTGLAAACERRGVTIHESTAVTEIAPRSIVTERGRVRAGRVVRATEGYTSNLPGEKRSMAPLYSLMIATEPLSDTMWDELGLAARPVFGDFRNLLIYGQRTADGRFAFGGRGAPYHWKSNIQPHFDFDDTVHAELARVLVELFPQLADTAITHRWGGPLGVPRDWRPSLHYDRAAGLARGGGYVGAGVATANLAGRCLADLLLERDTELVSLPWVGHTSRRWEPEPFRWAGINFGLWLAKSADASEERTGKPSWRAKAGNWLRGKSR